MRIGVNAVPLHIRMGGLRQYFLRLFCELLEHDTNNTYVFFYCAGNEAELEQLGTDRWREGAIRVEDQGEILLHMMTLDLFFCPFGVLWPRPLPIATVVQLADIQEAYYPQFFPAEDLHSRKLHHEPSTRIADAVITLSEFSRQAIAKHHQVNPDKIFVTNLVTDGPFPEPLNFQGSGNLILPDRFIFFPANHWHHKNHDVLLKALAFLKQERGMVIPLVCTGYPMANGYPLLEKTGEYGLAEQVCHVGYVSDEDMKLLYYRATLLCFPSLFEGFGMPVLEAMATGCPVVCANSTSLPEVVGDDAILFDPNDARDLADALLRVWNDESLRMELIAKGKLRARKFTTAGMVAAHFQAFDYAVRNFLTDSRTIYQHVIFNQLARLTALEEQNHQLIIHLKQAALEEQKIQCRLQMMEDSLSWRITKPLRRLGDRLKAL